MRRLPREQQAPRGPAASWDLSPLGSYGPMEVPVSAGGHVVPAVRHLAAVTWLPGHRVTQGHMGTWVGTATGSGGRLGHRCVSCWKLGSFRAIPRPSVLLCLGPWCEWTERRVQSGGRPARSRRGHRLARGPGQTQRLWEGAGQVSHPARARPGQRLELEHTCLGRDAGSGRGRRRGRARHVAAT